MRNSLSDLVIAKPSGNSECARRCFALFGQVVAMEYSNLAYGAVNLLSVDAHALQHPEDCGVKSNSFHLIRLCWLLEHGGDLRLGQGPRWLQGGSQAIVPPI